VEGAN
jgi:hypothetical protein